MNTNYEKDLNELKEQILKDDDTLVSKKDLLERFCKMDKEYNSEPWNLLQILANINILIGEEPCEDVEGRQDSVLGKIKAEIEALPKTYPFINHFDTYVKEDDVKRIIDKYKAEMESKE